MFGPGFRSARVRGPAPNDMSDPATKLVGTLVDERYEVERLIGRGGMGMVYLAHDLEQRRDIVLKMLAPHMVGDEAARLRFVREGRRLGTLDHPNIVKMYGSGQHGGLPYLVMEYLDGIPLHRYLESRRRLDVAEFVPIAAQVLSAVGFAHARDIMLRDVKPANIILCERGGKANVVKLLDFGLAKRVERDTLDVTKSHLVGTTTYLSPELIKGEPCDVRVDVYALGVLFFVLLSGRRPISGDNQGALLYNHVFSEPLRLEMVLPRGHHVPERLIRLIHRCLEKDPWDRPADARELAEELFECFPARMFALPRATDASRRRMADLRHGRSMLVSTADPEEGASYSPGVPPELSTVSQPRPLLQVIRTNAGELRPVTRWDRALDAIRQPLLGLARLARVHRWGGRIRRSWHTSVAPWFMEVEERLALSRRLDRLERGRRWLRRKGQRAASFLSALRLRGNDRAWMLEANEAQVAADPDTATLEAAGVRAGGWAPLLALSAGVAVVLGGSFVLLASKQGYQRSDEPARSSSSMATASVVADIPEGPPVVAAPQSMLRIDAVPGALVSIDGSYRGRVPFQDSVPAGAYRIEVEAPGFDTWEHKVRIASNEEIELVATLEPEEDRARETRRRSKKHRKRRHRARRHRAAKKKASAQRRSNGASMLEPKAQKRRSSAGIFLPTGD